MTGKNDRQKVNNDLPSALAYGKDSSDACLLLEDVSKLRQIHGTIYRLAQTV